MNVTLITTVFKEEKSINKFLKSVENQTLIPDEMIIVDGGSGDNTVGLIHEFVKRYPKIKIKLLTKKGNIATGRNEAIKTAKSEIILVSDAGCVLDKNWIKNISTPFKNKKIDVVAGYYEPTGNTIFQKCLATYTSVMPDKVDSDNFLPSSRSIAFRKHAWEEAGMYPEWLDTCEDLYFARELKTKGFKFEFVANAVVSWPQRKNLKEATIQFFRYAKGDGMAHYIRPNTPFLFFRYLIGVLMVFTAFNSQSKVLFSLIIVLIVGYLIWTINKNYKYIKNPRALIYLPILQFTADFAVIFGMSIGYLKSFSINRA